MRWTGRAGEQRVEASAAARLVGPLGAKEHAILAGHEPLGVIGRIAAHHADRQRLGDVFGDREELWHRLERLAQVVLIEPGHDDPLALIRQRVAYRRQSASKNCPSSMPTTSVSGATWLSSACELCTAADPIRISLCETMWSSPIASVDHRLENLHPLAGNLRAAKPADQLFALAAEHAADDDFDPALVELVSDDVHS